MWLSIAHLAAVEAVADNEARPSLRQGWWAASQSRGGPMPLQSLPPFWLSDYDSGNAEVDREHQELFAELAGFLSLFRREDPPVLARAFDRLVDKCREHFRSEEALLQSIDYPHLDRHVALHALLLSKCEQVGETFDTMPKALMEIRAGRLFEMIVVHVLTADLDFYPYLAASRLVAQNGLAPPAGVP
jgi:hemerythrin-like metal-binding protein